MRYRKDASHPESQPASPAATVNAIAPTATDEFEKIYYHLWHHEGRRARQGAMMNAPDYAHWHGFFELQQDLYDLEAIYNERMETGVIE